MTEAEIHRCGHFFASVGQAAAFRKLKTKGYLANLPLRCLPNVEVAFAGCQAPEHVKKEVGGAVLAFLRKNFITTNKSSSPMCLNDILTVGLSTLHSIARDTRKNSAWFAALRNDSRVFLDDRALMDHVHQLIAYHLTTIMVDFSRLEKRLFAYRLYLRMQEGGPPCQTVEISSHEARTARVVIDGAARTMYRVATHDWQKETVAWPLLTIDGKQFEAYIQGHALQRLEERIDCISPACIRHFVGTSALDGVTLEAGSARLLPYVIHGRKLGYFVVETAGDAAVFKTFLFITNDGTPEGEKLNARVRLSRTSKTYLELDKLSAFLLTDIRDDADLVRLFTECGMGQLFTLQHDRAKLHKELIASFVKNKLPVSVEELFRFPDESAPPHGPTRLK